MIVCACVLRCSGNRRFYAFMSFALCVCVEWENEWVLHVQNELSKMQSIVCLSFDYSAHLNWLSLAIQFLSLLFCLRNSTSLSPSSSFVLLITGSNHLLLPFSCCHLLLNEILGTFSIVICTKQIKTCQTLAQI